MNDPGTVDVVDVEVTNNKSEVVYYTDTGERQQPLPIDAKKVTMTMLSLMSTRPRVPTVPTIYELNNQKAMSFVPIYVIIGCIVVMGVLTNFLVCYIYRCRSRRATSNFFVIFFAIFDMFGCFIGIPLEVTVLALPYTYDVVAVCKIRGYIESLSVCSLSLTLICVAYDCYRKFCKPGDDFGVKKARICCIVSVLVAVVVSIPAAVVFGVQEVKTTYPNIKGMTCSVDQTQPQWLRIIYNVCVLGTFLVCLCAISALYCLIGVACCLQRQAEERGEKPSPAKQKFPKKHRFVREDVSSSSVTNYSEEVSRLHSQGTLSHSHGSYTDSTRVPLKHNSSGIVKTNSLQASSAPPSLAIVPLHVKNTRQTYIFMVISIIFVVFMLPFIVVMVLCATTTVFNQFSSNATEIVFNMCVRSYLLNYIVKPVIYFIFNVNFRKEVKHLFIKIWALCTGATGSSGSHAQRRSFIDGTSRSASRTPIYRPPRSSS
ncbi:alpha-2Da adrenergic receptor-like [Biomphalaria glabrata]|uniref:Alpha-2Da adrenergic receptor-like n=1 Tax=Biomphalaria glabrata TaxID=6526 RepID=A0A9W2ZVJ5_BIOGL|nr:alpha-2Da adrenergic receptor-like [Biomphalaria glabrata]XP_055878978.1 alpha-2Da adrenergic receptor-like [Biomphalaria glabrata]XP_055878979.1 alpha-2Da adrenergic receptor-like [Biomphalaria glabrata]XP_055878980.1 alpha-2Da adrenergic receptor-like [Biomphalaria glabrata]